jgi:dTDP-4-amino-4,6-dideoxygalactose transaminase
MIEDCAHAIETQYKGRHAGNFGDFGCFSFYVTKNLVTGEGGMVLTGRKEYADRIKILGLHGMSKDAWKRFGDEGYKHYQVVECGYKFNMTDIQAAIGLHQLRRLEAGWLRRQEIWDIYQEGLSDLPLILPAHPESDTRHAYHLYTLQIDPARSRIGRDAFLNEITDENIGVGVHYRSIPTHPYYKETFGWSAEDYPNSYRFGEQTVSLPLSAKLSDKDVNDVITAVKKVLVGN